MDIEKKHYRYDVFLSHNSSDKPAVRQLAEKLRKDGLHVWFDESIIKPGDNILLKIREGLKNARVLALVMSPNGIGSEWVEMEQSTVMFSDPTNKQRRLIPLLLENCEIPDDLRPLMRIDYRDRSDTAYQQLLTACRPPSTDPEPLPQTTATARLNFHRGGIVQVTRLFAKNQITLGRPKCDADLWLIMQGVDKDAMEAAMNLMSRHHASLSLDPEPTIRDNGSRNGSELNHISLDETSHALHNGDVIGFNNGALQLQVRLGAEKWLRLERLNNAPSLENYLLMADRAPIGGGDAAIPTTAATAESPAELRRLGGGFCIVSRSGPMQINGRTEPANKTIGVRDGDRIELDGIAFRFLCGAYPG